MPRINNKGPGDICFPNYAVVQTMEVSAIPITKGRLYTTGGAVANGNQIITPTADAGFLNGIYQAMRSISSAGDAGEHTVQFLTSRSRVLLPARAVNMHAGMRLSYNLVSNEVQPWNVAAGAGGSPIGREMFNYVGRIVEVYSATEADWPDKKKLTIEAAGAGADRKADLVMVDLGVW